MKALTDRYLTTLKARDTRFEIADAKATGLRIRVSTAGKKTWVFVFRHHHRLYRKTLGRYPAMSLADARAAANADRAQLDRKINPVTEAKEAARRAALAASTDPTVSELCTLYVERYAKINKKTWQEDERILLKDVVPRWGTLKAREVQRVHIVGLLDDLLVRGAGVGTNRTFATVRKMFNFAVARALLPYSPCQGIGKPVREQSRQLVLTEAEIKTFWAGLDAIPVMPAVRAALRLLLVTGQRPGEIAALAWRELDEARTWWTLPAERAKNKLSHRVPLTDLARECLASVDQSTDSEYVFRSRLRASDLPLKPNTLDHAMRTHRQALGFSDARAAKPHDLRRTAASHMAASGVPRLTIAKILNHAETGVTAVYDRHSYDAEKRAALESWSTRLRMILDASASISLPESA